MIPTIIDYEDDLRNDFEPVTDLPTKTYKLLLDKSRVIGLTDKQEAMKQAIFKTLQTERYRHNKVYSNNYGVELQELIGKDIPYVLPEIERRITEALLWDDRITGVYNFVFEVTKKIVSVTFKVDTVFGAIEEEMAVNI